MYKKIFFALIVLVSANACNRYEDGPFISFRSTANRLSGEWIATEFSKSGDSLAPDYIKDCDTCFQILKFRKTDKDAFAVEMQSRMKIDSCLANFTNKDKELIFHNSPHLPPYTKLDVTWTIKRLTNKELNLETTFNEKLYSIKFTNASIKL